MAYYTGIDVSLRSVSISVIDDTGQVALEAKVEADVEAIVILAKCVDLENELRGLLKVFGIRLASKVGHGAFDAELRDIVRSHEALETALVPLLDARTMLYKTHLKLDNLVKGVVRSDTVCRRLTSVLGVGPITALTFKAAVDDPSRFKSSRAVAAHFGLTPRRYQSGETDNPGHISRAGDADARFDYFGHLLATVNAGSTTPLRPLLPRPPS